MCVVAVVRDEASRLDEESVEKMYACNDHGAGIAWRAIDEATGRTVVRYEKGLELHQIQALVATVPAPFIAHFRISSVGGQIPALTHPFPISANVELALSGTVDGFVLFHNGHWGRYKDSVLDTALKMGKPLPIGPWSDTRGMAWMAHCYGPGILNFIDEKTVIIGPNPEDLQIFGTGWTKEEGVWVSNTSWKHHHTSRFRSSGVDGRKEEIRDTTDPTYTTAPASMSGGGCKSAKDAADVFLGKFEVVEGGTKVYNAKGKVIDVKGGRRTPLPLDKNAPVEAALLQYLRGEISKKQLKRARRKYEAKTRKAQQMTAKRTRGQRQSSWSPTL